MARQLLMGQCSVIIEASQLHSDRPHLVGLLWTGDRPIAETSTWQHTSLTTEKHAPVEFEPAMQQASGRRPTP